MEKCKIYDIPEIPDEIIQAINDGKLAVFIGAGVSRLLACWGWNRLANELIDCCFENGYINFKEKETLGYMNDQKKVITMCYGILELNKKKELFYDKMKEALMGDSEKTENRNIYDEISDFNALYITTNADKHFDKNFLPNNIKYELKDLDSNKLSKDILYHIHGSINDRESLVFTVGEYIERYNNTTFNAFMKEISDNYIILFIGYGLAEFEILDFLVTKFNGGKSKQSKHYALMPYFKGEENIYEYEQYYYDNLGINIVPFAKDELGYNQLYEVIKEWRIKINALSIVLPKSFKYIKECVDNFNGDNVQDIFQKIRNNKSLEDEFFKQLAVTNNPNPWFSKLNEKGYFLPHKNPMPIEDKYNSTPKWNVLDFLFNVLDKNKKNENVDITKLLIEIIDGIIDYKDSKGNIIENWRTNDIIIRIVMNLPREKIKEKYIDFIITALKSKWNNTILEDTLCEYELAKILNKEQMLKLLNNILDINSIYNGYIYPIIDVYWLQQILNKNKDIIGKEYPFYVVNIALKKIDNILEKDKDSYIFYKINNIDSIEDNEDGLGLNYEKELINFTRDMLQYCSPKQISKKIKEMMNSNDAIYRKLAIHIIKYHYEELKDIFWNLNTNPLEDYESKNEIYKFLEDKSKKFNDDNIDKILYWIENIGCFIAENHKNDEKMKKLSIVYRKKFFLYPLLNSNNNKVISLYNKYNKINSTAIEYPVQIHNIEMEPFKYISPLKVEDLEKMTSKEICEFLNEFKANGNFEKPSEEGLAETLEKYITDNFSEFISDINDYLNIPRIYQNSVMNSFEKIDLKNNTIYIKDILDFLQNLSRKFYIKTKHQCNDISSGLISLIRFLENGLLEINGIDYDEHLKKIKYILIDILNNVEEEDKKIRDYFTSALNMIRGNAYMALIKYCLKVSNIIYTGKDIKWEKDIKELFTSNLDKNKEPSLIYSSVLGSYLPQLMYLDKEWVVKNLNKIFDEKSEKYWKAAMESYLGYGRFYLDIYNVMKKHNHYEKALNTNFENKGTNEKLIQHICIAYLNGKELLENNKSLISMFLDKCEIESLEYVVNFILTARDKNININIKLKIRELWDRFILVLENNSKNEESGKILYKLCTWINFIDNLDEDVVRRVKKYVKNCRYNYDIHWIVKGLLKHVKKQPEEVADIYLGIIKNQVYPRDKKEIKKIVETLYKKGLKKQANVICNSYLSKGMKFLMDLYYKFNDDGETLDE